MERNLETSEGQTKVDVNEVGGSQERVASAYCRCHTHQFGEYLVLEYECRG